MRRYLIAYASLAICFVAMDFVWLTTTTAGLYAPALKSILLPNPNLTVAALFYVQYIFGLTIFAVAPGLDAGSWRSTAWRAGLFGFVAYATCDLTNLATLRGFTPSLVAIDLGWGVVVSTVAAVAAHAITRHVAWPRVMAGG